MKKTLMRILSALCCILLYACTLTASLAENAPSEIPDYIGEIADMSVQDFLAAIGPGYSETHLAESNPRIGYDPFDHLPTYFFLGIVADDTHSGFWMPELSYNVSTPIMIDLSELPDTPKDLFYHWWGIAVGVQSRENTDVSIKIENARIELPDRTMAIDAMNGVYTEQILESVRLDPTQRLIDIGLGEGDIDLLDTKALWQGIFNADITLLQASYPGQMHDKALFYTDQKDGGIPDLTPEWFKHLKSEGFNSIRFQVTWYNHTNDETYEIDKAWLERVEELVSLALDQGLYCLINVNWDMAPNYRFSHNLDYDKAGWLTLDGDPKVEERFAAVWEQIAEYFKDYDEYLFFESINEPSTMEYSGGNLVNVADEILNNLNRLNQIFVDSVRSTGGNNAKRFLLVPPYFQKGVESALSQFVLPNDPANHTIVCINYYLGDEEHGGGDPFPFIKKYLTANGISVVFTEFGAEIKANDLQSRIDFTRNAVAQAKELNIPIIYYGSDCDADAWWFRLYDWNTFEPTQPELIDILMGQK